jgi:hypothetical protein
MAGSETSYIYSFQVYTGKKYQQEKGLSYRIVMNLCCPMFGTNLSVYMDNLYTGPHLLKDLYIYIFFFFYIGLSDINIKEYIRNGLEFHYLII